jgi:hypothetical protein
MRRWSKWQVRDAKDLTTKQVEDFIRVGLLDEPDEEGWAADVLDRIDCIHEMGNRVPALHRRVIYLGYPPHLNPPTLSTTSIELPKPVFGVHPEKIREAMVRLTSSLPAVKMRAVDAACVWYGSRLAGVPLKRRPLPVAWRPPVKKEWKAILEGPDAATFAWQLPEAYTTASTILPRYEQETGDDLGTIPFDERVTLVMIRHLSALPGYYPSFNRSEGWEKTTPK